MAFDWEEVRQSQEIFAALLEKQEIRERSSMKALFDTYMTSESVQELVKSQCEAVGCTAICYVDVIYLIPNQDNRWLRYSKADLKRRLCHSDASEIDYYLAQFAILCLLLEFYDEQGSEHKMREYIRSGDLLNSIGNRLEEGRSKYSEEEQEAYGIVFTRMCQRYESMKAGTLTSKSRATKTGFLSAILSFFEEQGLVALSDGGDFIRTTDKLDHFMDWNLLNTANFSRVLAVVKEAEADEQDSDDEADQYQL